jgi:co-chaperonin GroES (HSP10)
MANNINVVDGMPQAIGNRVLVSDMYFGEQTTSGGIIVSSDDGKTRGVYPRWAKVFHKGPDNKDDYNIGEWILVEHGRWTRGINFNINDQELELRMVEAESVLAVSDKRPEELNLGSEYTDGQAATIDPSVFLNQ